MATTIGPRVKRVSVYLPEELHNRARERADAEGRSFSSLVKRALHTYVQISAAQPAAKNEGVS